MRYCVYAFLLFSVSALWGQQHPVNSFPSIYTQRGIELYEEGRFNAAIAQFEEALKNQPLDQQDGDLLFYHAMSKLYAGHENAEPFLTSYLENNPNAGRAQLANLALGDYFYNQGKYGPALSYYREVDEKSVDKNLRSRFLFRVGFCYVNRGKYKEGKESLEKVVKNGGEFQSIAQYYYGYACLMEKDFESAYSAFRTITDKNFEMVHFYMAQVLYQLSRYEEAISELDKLNTRKVKKNEANWLRAQCYYRMKSYAKAAEFFEAVNPSPKSTKPQEQFEIAYSYAKCKRYNESIPWFREVAQNNDSLAQIASFELGNVLLEMKNYREAQFAYSEVWRTGFNEEIARLALYTQAKIAVQMGEANSTKLLDKYTRLFPKSPEAKEANKLKARLLLNTDKYREAVEILEGMDDLDAQTEEIYQKVTLARGMELFKSRRWDDANDLFKRCMAKKANRKFAAQAGYWYAESLNQSGKSTDALQAYKDFINMPKSDEVSEFAYAYYAQGYHFFEKKNYSEAAIYFSQFTQKLGNQGYDEAVVHDAHLRMGDCYLMTRELDKSVKAYAYVSGKRGRDADYALFHSGLIYGLLGNSEEKISTLKRLVRDYPNSRYVMDGYDEVAAEYMELRNYDQAKEFYSQILTKFPGTQITRKAYSALGRIYYQKKDIDASVDSYSKLYDEFKGTADAQSAAEMVKTILTEEGRAKDFVRWASTRGGMSSMAEDSILYETAITAYDREEYKKAAGSFESYLSEKPEGNFVISAQYYLGMSYEQLKQPQKAVEMYKKVAVANSGEYKEDATLAVLKIYGPNAECADIITYLEIIEQITNSRDIQEKAWKSMMYCYGKSGNAEGMQKIASKVMGSNSADKDMKFESQLILVKNQLKQRSASSTADENNQLFSQLKTLYSGNDNRFAAEAKYLEAELHFGLDSLNATKESCYELLDQFNGYDEWVGKSLVLLGDAFAKEGDFFNARVTYNTILENFTDKSITETAKDRVKRIEGK